MFISYQGYALKSGTMEQSPCGEIICSLAKQEFFVFYGSVSFNNTFKSVIY